MTAVQVAAASAVVRAGLESVIRSSGAFSLAGAVSMDDLEQRSGDLAADVLLVGLPQLNDEWIATLSSYSIPVVVLTEAPDSATLFAALRAKIRGVLSPDAGHEEIAAAVQAAAAGLIVLEPAVPELLRQGPRATYEALEEPLTPREIEVLTMLADGIGNKTIAFRLGISEHTVKFHVTSIMGKLHAGSRTEAVTLGIRRGLILI